MSVSQATVDLLFKAQNLAGGAIAEVTGDLGKLGAAGVQGAGRLAGAFKGIGTSITTGVGMSVEQLASGGSLADVLGMAGAFMAGELAQNFGEKLLEKLAESSLIEAIAAPLGAIGSAIGGIISAAIPIGMALLPVILIGALVAAITVLIVNPEIRNKVLGFAGELVGHIGDGIRTGLGILVDIVPKAFNTAFAAVTTALVTFQAGFVAFILAIPGKLIGLGGDIVRTVIGGLGDLGRQVAIEVYKAFSSLHLDIGPFHISASGVQVDLPKIDVPHFAVGTPYVPADMLAVIHKGEAVIPAAQNPYAGGSGGPGGGGSGVTIQGVSERQLLDMVDRGLYFRLQRKAS